MFAAAMASKIFFFLGMHMYWKRVNVLFYFCLYDRTNLSTITRMSWTKVTSVLLSFPPLPRLPPTCRSRICTPVQYLLCMYSIHRCMYIIYSIRLSEKWSRYNPILLSAEHHCHFSTVSWLWGDQGDSQSRPRTTGFRKTPWYRSRKPVPIAQVLAWFHPASVCFGFAYSICTPASLANASPHHPILISFMTGLSHKPGCL